MKGFGSLLHSEWTKFRTVRGWVAGMMVAGALITGLGLLPGAQGSCKGANSCVQPVGPEGEEVSDSFSFVHQTLNGDGSITVRLSSLTGQLPPKPGSEEPQAGLTPWAKAGLIIKEGTQQGSPYAAVMITGGKGTRMQYNYVHDQAGPSGGTPNWLRLTRSGEVITGEQSADGSHWTVVGTAKLSGLPSTVEAGLFVTSPQHAETTTESLGAAGAMGGPTRATATFDSIDRTGSWTGAGWTAENIGGPANAGPQQRGEIEPTADGFSITGSGDIAPATSGAAGIGATITQTLVGTFAGLIVVVVIAAMFATSEYRRGLIRTTLAASPRRGRVLAAKALVIGGVTCLSGLISAAAVVTIGQKVLRSNGVYVHPATTATEVRVIAGTAALLAVAAVLGLALGALLRRSTTAITVAIVTIVLPYLLALTVLPAGAGQWLLRISPAAAFAVQQSAEEYEQVANLYTPINGFFPLAPWAGLSVLAAWTLLALGLAGFLLRRRDA